MFILIFYQLGDMRTSRQLAGRIPESGATLYDLLGKEVQLKVMMIDKMFE
jgi:hypothetical protein